MKNFKAGFVIALSSLLFSAQCVAATFVYVSNAEDGDIGSYTLQSDGSLKAGPRVLMTLPRLAVMRQNINHLSHHRGQLTVYLRLLDVPIPSIYGPTADEQW